MPANPKTGKSKVREKRKIQQVQSKSGEHPDGQPKTESMGGTTETRPKATGSAVAEPCPQAESRRVIR